MRHRTARDLLRPAIVVGADLLEKVRDEHRDVLAALAQRRQLDRHDREPVVQVLAEPPAGDLGLQILVRRGDDADVDLDRLAAADALELALLEHAQHLRLRVRVHVADLVEEQRAAIGELELAAALLGRAGERALLVAEQLALDQLGRDRRAVELHERPVLALGVLVHRARDELLAGAVLAGDQHAPGARRGLRHLIEDRLHRGALADHREVGRRTSAQPRVLAA